MDPIEPTSGVHATAPSASSASEPEAVIEAPVEHAADAAAEPTPPNGAELDAQPAPQDEPTAEDEPTAADQPASPHEPASNDAPASNHEPASTHEPAPHHDAAADETASVNDDEPASDHEAAAESTAEQPAASEQEATTAPSSVAPADLPVPSGPPGSGGETAGAMTATGLRSGQIIEGKVTAVDATEVVLELADGTTGVIGKRHLTANGQLDPTELLAVGDGVEAAVLVRDDPKGRIVLSRAWALKQRAWEQVEAAKAANRPLTGKVTGQVKGGLVVDVGTRAFLPASQIDVTHVDDLASFVGQDIEALVQEADRANDKIVLSRRNLLRAAQRSKANDFAATLAPGQVHRGRVSLLTDFGAFVEIGGVRGLVHLSELSWGRVERAADVVAPGNEVEVKVLAIKPGKKLSLSIRALTPDPLTTLETGQILQGVVTRLADFGAFVRVADGAEGLVHVTELAEYRVHAPEEVVAPGDEVLVKVLKIDRKRRRLDLSVNQALLS